MWVISMWRGGRERRGEGNAQPSVEGGWRYWCQSISHMTLELDYRGLHTMHVSKLIRHASHSWGMPIKS